MNLDSLYQEIILDHYRTPRHKGLLDPYDVEVHHVNPTCGDEVTLRVRVQDGPEGARVAEVSYDGQGCSISQASTSVMTELVTGRSVEGALATSDVFRELMLSRGKGDEPDEDVLEDAVAFAGVAKYPARVKCALLGWMAWKDATTQALAAQEGRSGNGDSDSDGPTVSGRSSDPVTSGGSDDGPIVGNGQSARESLTSGSHTQVAAPSQEAHA